MKRKVLSLSCLIAAGSLLMGMTAVTKADKATTVPGAAISNGTIHTAAADLKVFSSIAKRPAGYLGSLYIAGQVNGQDVFIATPLSKPTFFMEADGETKTCEAYSDVTYAGMPARVTYDWHYDAQKPDQTSVAWTVQAYNVADAANDPTGDILFSSDDLAGTHDVALDGQVMVWLPR